MPLPPNPTVASAMLGATAPDSVINFLSQSPIKIEGLVPEAELRMFGVDERMLNPADERAVASGRAAKPFIVTHNDQPSTWRALPTLPWVLPPMPAQQFVPAFIRGESHLSDGRALFKALPPAVVTNSVDLMLTVELTGCSLIWRVTGGVLEMAHILPGKTWGGEAIRIWAEEFIPNALVFGRVGGVGTGVAGYDPTEVAEIVGRRFSGGAWSFFVQVHPDLTGFRGQLNVTERLSVRRLYRVDQPYAAIQLIFQAP